MSDRGGGEREGTMIQRRSSSRHRHHYHAVLASSILVATIVPHIHRYDVIRPLSRILLPHGLAVDVPPYRRPRCIDVDRDDASLREYSIAKKIYERREVDDDDVVDDVDVGAPLLVNPETVIFDGDGTMYVMNEDSWLVSLTDIRPGGVVVVVGEGGEEYEMYDERAPSSSSSSSSSSSPPYYTARAIGVADLGVGRPLGGKFDVRSGCLYYADAILGLARVCNLPPRGVPTDRTNGNASGREGGRGEGWTEGERRPVVELIANRVRLEDGTWSYINYADDVDIGPRTGHVYFSDATDVYPDRGAYRSGRDDGTTTTTTTTTTRRRPPWDVLYASKVDALRGMRTGRLLRYKPETGEVDVLADGVAFANGVAVIDEDEEYVLYTSTFEARVMIYRLNGRAEDGELGGGDAVLLDGFPGLLDGIDCSIRRRRVNGGGGDRICHVAIVTTLSPLLVAVMSLPSWLGIAVRSLLMMIPRSLSPKMEPYGGVAEIRIVDMDDENDGRPRSVSASITRIFQDPDGRDFSAITGVTEYDGKLYLGTLHGNYVGVVSLE
ncbi:hypothetical protein ACHAXA_009206 [Cyclostephanos tholiformis]|uniref:Strictosidine synthase conserved region domain-containing protein n=1 Tax=Cyclostephanos tholiformis TaxID=382380 RepID=A0ABD3RFK7_9STRA